MTDQAPAISVLINPQSARRSTLDAQASDTVANVKARIQQGGGPPPDRQLLVYRGMVLEDGDTLADYNAMWPIYLHWDEELAELEG